jgi:hypothetical protein
MAHPRLTALSAANTTVGRRRLNPSDWARATTHTDSGIPETIDRAHDNGITPSGADRGHDLNRLLTHVPLEDATLFVPHCGASHSRQGATAAV